MPDSPNYDAAVLLMIALIVGVIVMLVTAWRSGRRDEQENDLPPRRERRRDFLTSPDERAYLAGIYILEPDDAVLAAWMYSGETRAANARWRQRRDVIRLVMPTLGWNLDRLVREWPERRNAYLEKPYRPGLTEYDHRGALIGVASSWSISGRSYSYHRARVADVTHLYPELARALNSLVLSDEFRKRKIKG